MQECLFSDAKTTLTQMPAEIALLIMNDSLRSISFKKELSLRLSPDNGDVLLENAWISLQQQPNFINHASNLSEAYSTLRIHFHYKRKMEENWKKEKDKKECASIIIEPLNKYKNNIVRHGYVLEKLSRFSRCKYKM